MSGSAIVEVRNGAELDERSRISARLPRPNDCHTYTLRDPALRRGITRGLLTRHAIHRAGDLQLSHVADRFGTRVGIGGNGIDFHCFSFVDAGRMELTVPGFPGPMEAAGAVGVIHGGRSGTGALTADGTARTNLWIATSRIEGALAACLGEPPRAPLVFEPRLDWSRGAGAALRRLVLHATEALARPGAEKPGAHVLAALTDLCCHTALHGLRHNHSDRLGRVRDSPAPRQLRRAEDFMRAHAAEPLRMDQVARASGCSVRSMQLAFRTFRDTTPHAALTGVRLEHARHDLAAGTLTVAAVAGRWGFTNAGRFAAQYLHRFGESPAATRRRPEAG